MAAERPQRQPAFLDSDSAFASTAPAATLPPAASAVPAPAPAAAAAAGYGGFGSLDALNDSQLSTAGAGNYNNFNPTPVTGYAAPSAIATAPVPSASPYRAGSSSAYPNPSTRTGIAAGGDVADELAAALGLSFSGSGVGAGTGRGFNSNTGAAAGYQQQYPQQQPLQQPGGYGRPQASGLGIAGRASDDPFMRSLEALGLGGLAGGAGAGAGAGPGAIRTGTSSDWLNDSAFT